MKNILFILFVIFGLFLESRADANVKKAKRCLTTKVVLKESLSFYERDCYEQINKVRLEHRLKPLKWWNELSDCARGHSENINDGSCPFGHHGFDQRMDHMNQLCEIRHFGENVAYCYNYEDPINVCVKGWMESEGHRRNILTDFEETGIGIAISSDGKFYITQLFASRQKSN
ncbi:MAG: CAP domain-containing protein [Parachlamydiaceae bacterium]